MNFTAILEGTVNNPTTFPPSPMHGPYHWAFEHLLAASLISMTAAVFVSSGSSHAMMGCSVWLGPVTGNPWVIRQVPAPTPA